MIHFGKPTFKAFEFVHKHMERLYGPSNRYVMIDDNIDTGIVGAYNYGWQSVLVTTGVSKHSTTKANHVCRTVQ